MSRPTRPLVMLVLLLAVVGGWAAAPARAAVPSEPERVAWRIKIPLDFYIHTPGVGPDGTIYVPNLFGRTQAVAPDGSTRWTFPAGGSGPISVAGDGTIVVAGGGPGAVGGTDGIFAINPDGTLKWGFTGTGDYLMAGPSIGPDGNVYAVTDSTGIGFFSLTPTGQLRFSKGQFTDYGAHGQRLAFGPDRVYFGFDMMGLQPATFFAYDFAGTLRWTAGSPDDPPQPDAGPNGNVVFRAFPSNVGKSLFAYSPGGQRVWSFYEFPGNVQDAPDVGPDNVTYSIRNLSTMLALNPDGTVKWRYVDPGIMFEPVVDPTNSLVFTGGRVTYGEPGFFLGVSKAGQPLWKVPLPTEPGFGEYGQLVPVSRPVYSPDGSTAYAITDVAGDGNTPYAELYAYLYAVRTGVSGAPTPVSLAAPTNLAARAISGGRIDLTWTDNSTGESGFRIQRCAGRSCTNFASIAVTGPNATSYSDTGRTPGTYYRYRVRAESSAAVSAWSNGVRVRAR